MMSAEESMRKSDFLLRSLKDIVGFSFKVKFVTDRYRLGVLVRGYI
jgi:hypothetical protein